MDEKQKLVNVITLGSAFGLLFTGAGTLAATSETILRSYQERTGERKGVKIYPRDRDLTKK